MRTLLIAGHAPRAGATTAAINLAAAAAAGGKRVLLLDADPAAPVAAALKLGDAPARGAPLGPIRARATSVPLLYVGSPYNSARPANRARDLAESLEAVGDRSSRDYDLVVIDAPASLCEATADFAHASDAAVVVQLAHTPSLRALPAYLARLKAARGEGAAVRLFGLLLTLPPGLPVGSAGEAALRQQFKGLLPDTIPHDPAVAEAVALGKPVVTAWPDAPASRRYSACAALLEARWQSEETDASITRAGLPVAALRAGLARQSAKPGAALLDKPGPPGAEDSGAGDSEADLFLEARAKLAEQPASGRTQTYGPGRAEVRTPKGPDLLDPRARERVGPPPWQYALLAASALLAVSAAAWFALG